MNIMNVYIYVCIYIAMDCLVVVDLRRYKFKLFLWMTISVVNV